MRGYSIGDTGPCPFCGVVVQFCGQLVRHGYDPTQWFVSKRIINGSDTEMGERVYRLGAANCPNCGEQVLAMHSGKVIGFAPTGVPEFDELSSPMLLWPKAAGRPIAQEVADHIAADYREAAEVLSISPKASAALSRRCLQSVLQEAGRASQRTLSQQIEYVLPNLPSDLGEQLDAIRIIGNFAAHPTKNQSSGEIVDVELVEAEWNLDVLDLLFDYYYVRPAAIRAKRAALNDKLIEAGRPPMKNH